MRKVLGLAMVLIGCGAPCRITAALDPTMCGELESMELPATLPAALGNSKGDDEHAALLGFSLFFDARLSAGQDTRCASCHLPERVFADGRQAAMGVEPVDRNSPSIYTAAWHRWQTWDGKADSLWSQPLLALENPKEMNLTRLELAHRVATSYTDQYQSVFGALPAGLSSWPSKGKPGDASFDHLPIADQLEVNRIAANVGKSLEAYMRRDAHQRGRFDDFVAGAGTLTPPEERGLSVFFQAGCSSCHSGPTFSDDAFHAIGVPPVEGKQVESARAGALAALSTSVFSVNGPFHEGPMVQPTAAATASDEGAYRTPSLRNTSRTGPWGHNGYFTSLDAMIDFHSKKVLTTTEHEDLMAFLKVLDVIDPPSPWNNWPDR